jgi:phage-related protein
MAVACGHACAVQWVVDCGKSGRTWVTKRTARVLLCFYRGHLVALHGFIKKTRTTPDEDLALARKRQKELER